MNYVVISKKADKHGKSVLVSFASKPMWKDFEAMRRQNESMPNYHDEEIATKALKKYANTNDFEIVDSSIAARELEQYKKDNPNWI